MIVCHCNRIDHREIEQACSQLVADDPWRVLTPVAVYKELGKRPRCGSCLPLAANLIHTRDALSGTNCATCPLADRSQAEWTRQSLAAYAAEPIREAAE